MLIALIQIIDLIINLVTYLVIAQFVMSLLISFNVVNTHNEFVAGVWKAINALLDPILKPVRRMMPDTGMIDLSPMALIIGLTIVQYLLGGLLRSAVYL